MYDIPCVYWITDESIRVWAEIEIHSMIMHHMIEHKTREETLKRRWCILHRIWTFWKQCKGSIFKEQNLRYRIPTSQWHLLLLMTLLLKLSIQVVIWRETLVKDKLHISKCKWPAFDVESMLKHTLQGFISFQYTPDIQLWGHASINYRNERLKW